MRRCSSLNSDVRRVVDVSVEAIDEPNHFGKVGSLHVFRSLCGEQFKSLRILFRIQLHCRGNILIAKVQHCKAEALRVAGDHAFNVNTAESEAPAPGVVNVIRNPPDAIAENLRLVCEGGEHAADGVVRSHLLESQLERPDLFFVDATSVSRARDVGPRLD